MSITALISFSVEKATVAFGMTNEGPRKCTVDLKLKLEGREDVETPEKRSLKNAEWSINLSEGVEFNSRAKEEEAIGFLNYFPESKSPEDFSDESCCASAVIETATFGALWNLVTSGRLPDTLLIGVKGMSYGSDWEGSDKTWDIATSRSVAILEVTFNFPVAGATQLSSESIGDPDLTQANVLATSADVQVSAARVAKSISDLQAKVVAQLRYIFVAVALTAFYFLLK